MPSADLAAQPELPLQPGSSGAPVTDLQVRLERAGFPSSPDAQGHYGSGTADAVARFQTSRGLRADGRCGVQTWLALVEAGYAPGDRLLYLCQPMLRGEDVHDLQTRLGQLGFLDDRIDGIFGPRTAAALVDFQRNAGLVTDGIYGPATRAALARLGRGPLGGVKAGVVDRDRLRHGPLELAGATVVIGEAGLDALAVALERVLHDAGARVLHTRHPSPSARADAANTADAQLYLDLVLQPEPPSQVCFYATSSYCSAGGQALAEEVASHLVGLLPEPCAVRGMRLPVLRETRMPAVACELGPATLVVERLGELARALGAAIEAWIADPVGDRRRH